MKTSLTGWLAIALCVSIVAYTLVAIFDNAGGDNAGDALRSIAVLLAGALVGQQAQLHIGNGNGNGHKK